MLRFRHFVSQKSDKNRKNLKPQKSIKVMAVLVKVVQDNRKNSNKLFYGKAVAASTLDTKKLAKRISENTTATYPDTLAVLTALVKVMNYNLGNSIKVKLDNFGYFYVSATTSGALARDEWNIKENLKSVRVRFLPTSTRDGATSKVTSKSLGFGYKAVVVDPEAKPKQEEEGE